LTSSLLKLILNPPQDTDLW